MILKYFLVRTGIFLLRVITPVSFLSFTGGCLNVYMHLVEDGGDVVATLNATVIKHPWLSALWCYATLETAFYVFVFLPRRKATQKPPVPPPEVTPQERRILFEQCIAASSDIESFLRGWFHGAPVESLKRDNIMEWLAFVTTISDVFDKDEMECYVRILEEKLDRSFEDGRNEHVRCMRPSLDAVEVVHRPLLWYLIIMSLDFATYLALYYIGLRHYASPYWFSSFPFRPYSIFSRISGVPELSYWRREHISKRKQPLIYIHGIGIGLLPYILFFRDIIQADRDVGIIVLEIPAISARLVYPIRQMTAARVFAGNVYSILQDHHLEHIPHVLVANSFGTFLASQLLSASRRSASDLENGHLRLCPRISSLVLIDPIPFLIFEPDLTYAFIYRFPGHWRTSHWVMWYFSSRDIAVAGVLGREFFWYEGVLWRENVIGMMQEGSVAESPRLFKTLVVLGGNDQIVPTGKVWRYLTNGVDATYRSPTIKEDGGKADGIWESDDGSLKVVNYLPLDHAQIFISRRARQYVAAEIARLSAGSPRVG